MRSMRHIRTHPWTALTASLAMLIAASFTCFYMLLAVGVSDGAGYLTAAVMLACCVFAILTAMLFAGLSIRVLLAAL